MDVYNFVSLGGIFFLLIFAWVFSSNKKNINWRVIYWGLGLQALLALFIFVFPAGSKLFLIVNNAVVGLLDTASAGAKFIFGRLALSPGTVNEAGEPSLGFFLAFQGLPTIIFFSSLVSVLYFLNIMPFIIRVFARIFTRLMRISGAESLVASSNIFVGVEAALTVRPHLREMTKSEICTVLTAGMATVASNILAVYVFSLKGQFPNIAGHLVSASFLSAPAAIMMSKLIVPEDDTPKTLGVNIAPYYKKERSLFEAIINGANTGVKVIAGIAALLVAILGLAALVDLILGAAGGKLNSFFSISFDWSLKGILGYIFYPFTLILGVPVSDAWVISKIIGERAIITEVAAYQDLSLALSQGLLSSPRSAVITTYALCGFAHIASLAIFIGGISALVPEKTAVLVKVGFRSLLAATLACLLTACIAGVFFNGNSILLAG